MAVIIYVGSAYIVATIQAIEHSFFDAWASLDGMWIDSYTLHFFFYFSGQFCP